MSTPESTPPGRGPSDRGHAILPHTADVGLSAHAPTFAAALEEAAVALGELTADLPAGVPQRVEERVHVAAGDAEALLVAWLNELIGLMEIHHAGLLDVSVTVDPPTGEPPASVEALVRLVPFDAGARPRVGVKSATYHRIAVDRDGDGWRLRVYLDV